MTLYDDTDNNNDDDSKIEFKNDHMFEQCLQNERISTTINDFLFNK